MAEGTPSGHRASDGTIVLYLSDEQSRLVRGAIKQAVWLFADDREEAELVGKMLRALEHEGYPQEMPAVRS